MNDELSISIPKEGFLEDTQKKRPITLTPENDNQSKHPQTNILQRHRKPRASKLHLSVNHPKLKITSSRSSRKESGENISNEACQSKSMRIANMDDDPSGINMSHLMPIHNDFNAELILNGHLKEYEQETSVTLETKKAKRVVLQLPLSIKKASLPEIIHSPASMHHSIYREMPGQMGSTSPGKIAVQDNSKSNEQIKNMILNNYMQREKDSLNSVGKAKLSVNSFPFRNKRADFNLEKLIQKGHLSNEKLSGGTNSQKQTKVFFPGNKEHNVSVSNKSHDSHALKNSSMDDDIHEDVKMNKISARFISVSPGDSPPPELSYHGIPNYNQYGRGITLGNETNPSPGKPVILRSIQEHKRSPTRHQSMAIKETDLLESDKLPLKSKSSPRKNLGNRNTIYGSVTQYLKRLPMIGSSPEKEDQCLPPLMKDSSEAQRPLGIRLERLYGSAYPSMVTYVSFTGDDHLLARVDTSNGNLLAIYQGDMHEGMPCGVGVLKYSGAEYYSGAWVGGLAHGHGELRTHGYGYVGQFVDGIFDGHGQLKIKGKGVYQGNFIEGKFHGKGKFTWENRSKIYIGKWRNGLFHGKGLMMWSDGRKFYGEYLKGQKNGKGLCIFASGGYRYGNWSRGAFLGYIE